MHDRPLKSISTSSQFSFEELATEVNSVVEDLRWLHLELSVRNRINDILFQGVESPEEFLRSTLADLRLRLGLMEVSAFIRIRNAIRAISRDFDPAAIWREEAVPWNTDVERAFREAQRGDSAHATVLHYAVEGQLMSVLIMPVIVEEEPAAVILFVTRTNALVPRFRHFIGSIAPALSVSIDYIRNVQRLRRRSHELETRVDERTAELEWTHNFLVKLLDSVSILIMACDRRGRVLIWNRAAENFTGVRRADVNSFDDFLQALGVSAEQNGLLYNSLKTEFDRNGVLPTFEQSLTTRGGEHRNVSWTHATIPSKGGQVLIEYGMDVTDTGVLLNRIKEYEDNLEGMLLALRSQKAREHGELHELVHESSVLILGLTGDGRVTYCNRQVEEMTGRRADPAAEATLIEDWLPEQERGEAEELLERLRSRAELSFPQSAFHLRNRQGEAVYCVWLFTRARQTALRGTAYWAFGFPAPEAAVHEAPPERRPLLPFDAKLSQRYRFLMKYVPFPLIHLDAEDRIINSNPAFEEIAGMQVPYGTPIADFATFEVHSTGDPAACNLYILTREGITLTHRGIVTSLTIFGKTIREITLDI